MHKFTFPQLSETAPNIKSQKSQLFRSHKCMGSQDSITSQNHTTNTSKKSKTLTKETNSQINKISRFSKSQKILQVKLVFRFWHVLFV